MSVSSAGQGLRTGVCTSSTRPSSPYTGQTIYETDTGYLRVWDGPAWDYLSQSLDSWNMPRGLVTTTSGGTNSLGYRTTVTNQTVNQGATADLTNSSMTFTAVSGRLYRYAVNGFLSSTSASGICRIDVLDGATTINQTYMNISNTIGGGMLFASALITGSGSKTVKVSCTSNTGNTTMGGSSNYGCYTLEDIGPA